jgi:site-specific DNA-methyltransferase (adenine-specific)
VSQIVINGNNIDVLKTYPDNYFDSVVTDPPYGLGKEPNAAELMKDWIEFGYHEIKGTGFMGKEWDAFVPQPVFWKEVFRVLKHGGHVLSFFGTRTYDWGVMSMRFAGFEVRDCIQWLYGSGFPKSHNIGKAIDKLQGNEREVKELGRAGKNSKAFNDYEYRIDKEIYSTAGQYEITKGNSEWEGWGSALKPANEPIVLARKPLEKGLSIAENILKWGVGGINIDGCRVGNGAKKWETPRGGIWATDIDAKSELIDNPQGRFPANIILDETAAEILDEQSGVSKSQRSERGNINYNLVYGKYKSQEDTLRGHDDKGGASRFFYVAKASKAERNKGLEGFEEKRMEGRDEGQDERSVAFKARPTPMANVHPTVKPIKLMQYLVKMITPPNGIVLDPFCGSGTTGVACKLEGYIFVGMEQDPEYTKIAQSRIKNYIEIPDDYKEEVIETKTTIIKNNIKPQLTLF